MRLAIFVLIVALLALALRPIGPSAFARSGSALTFVDRAGLPLGTVLASDAEHAVYVPLQAISPRFLAAIVGLEDARFRQHDGVDPLALARAALGDARSGRITSGGSTITMQLARLRYDLPRSWWGKLEEVVLALRIERGTSKAAILEAYANRVPMGSDLVGVEAAARTYFGVPAGDLDWAQATLLAALPNDPVALDPYLHRAALERRRRAVIAYLEQRGVIGADDARAALAEQLVLVPRREGIGDAPHLAFRLAASTPVGVERVRTTIDRGLQRYVSAALDDVLAALHERAVNDGAALVVDNATGDVLAYVGSPDYFDRAILGRNDGVVALRQPGSALKPFLYELAFERRAIRPTTMLQDVPTAYALPDARLYAPTDYSGAFAGPVRPRIALADSLNVPAVRTLSAVGVDVFEQRLHGLGFTHLDKSPDYYGLGLTLGSGEVTLEELARAYATMARGGRPLRLRYRADDPSASDDAQIGSPSEWALVTDMLSDAEARARAFGVSSLLRLPFPSAVKTGTSSDYRDTWTIGFSRDYTVAVWVGNFNGAPMRRVSGVTGAAPLWNRIMLHLAETYGEPGRFDPPHGYARTAMCATSGTRPDAACPAVVTEWLDAGDRIALRNARPAPLPPLRIASPLDGAIYRPGGVILARAAGATGTLHWRINGDALGSGRVVPITLRAGAYTLVADDGVHRAIAHLWVEPKPVGPQRGGFTVR